MLLGGDTMAEWIVTNCESVGNTHDICQDHTEFMVSNSNVYVGALADGVSSNRYSDIGAKAVTKFACEEMCDNFNKYFTQELTSRNFVRALQDKVNLEYGSAYDINQMKSTLIFCAVRENNYIVGHIGDGAVLCFGKYSYVISPPQENEVGGTATFTVLDYNADEHFEFKIGYMNDIDGFLMTSDGLLGNVYYSGTDIPQLAYELFGSVYKATSPTQKRERDALFKNYLADHIQKGNSFADDCSIFMIARKKQTGYVDYEIVNGFEADIKWPCTCGHLNRMDEVRCSNCRTMYTSLYSNSIVRINSKEGFFSKLYKWMMIDSADRFDPGEAAEIIDMNNFLSLCNTLKSNSSGITARLDRNQVHSLSSEKLSDQEECDKHVKAQKNKSQRYSSEKNENSVEETIRSVVKQGMSVIGNLFQRLKSKNSYDSQKQKLSDKSDIQKVFPIELSYAEMNEVAYQLKFLPMTFVSVDDSIRATSDQKRAVNAMFSYDGLLDVFWRDEEGATIIHFYNKKDEIISVCDKNTDVLYCRVNDVEEKLLKDECFIPKYLLEDELKQCNKLNSILINYRKQTLQWKWLLTYVQSKADASQMLWIFRKILEKKGYKLDDVIADIWFVARDRNSSELIAYILTNHYLLRLKSIGKTFVEVDQVVLDDDYALQLRNRYLMKRR